jgi:hypothetical protein
VYAKKGWISASDWLGNGFISNFDKCFLSYEDAKKIIHEFKFKSVAEWRKWRNSRSKPDNIPSNPAVTYKNNWISWGDFLGTETRKYSKIFLPFDLARSYVLNLKIKSRKEYKQICKQKEFPLDIPRHPQRIYKISGWINWYDWLGIKKNAT